MNKSKKYPKGAPDPAKIAEQVAAFVDFDQWDDWTGDLVRGLRSRAVQNRGHGVFKELYTAETHDKIVRLQDTDRHLIVPNMKFIRGGVQA